MVFSSFVFLLAFLPIVLLLYYLCPARLRNLVLLVFSLVFYAWGEPVYVLIMLFSIVFDYANGRLIEHFKNKNCPGKAKAALIGAETLPSSGFLSTRILLSGVSIPLQGQGCRCCI